MILVQRSASTLATTLVVVLTVALLVAACTEDSPAGLPGSFDLTVVLDGIGIGTVTSDPVGIDCGPAATACTATFDEGTDVTLIATPEGDHAFLSWSGGATGTAAAATVAITGDVSVTAEFDDPDLAVQSVGGAGGTVVSRDGQLTLEIPAGALGAMTAITIERVDAAALGEDWAEMVAADDVAFAYELGPDGTTFATPATVSLPATSPEVQAGTVTVHLPGLWTDGMIPLDAQTATFDRVAGTALVTAQISHFSPWVQQVEGTEFLWSLPPGQVPVGSEFTVFVHTDKYIGHLSQSAGGPITTVGISESPYQDEAFFTYRCTAVGSGSVLARASSTAEPTYNYGGPGPARTGWTLDEVECVGHALTVTTSGLGSGTVTSSPEGIHCGSGGDVCAAEFPPDGTVTLTATPDAGSTFEGCGGDASENAELTGCVVTMSGDRAADVTFGVQLSEQLAITMTGEDGSVVSDPEGIDCSLVGGVMSGTCTTQMSGDVSLTATTADGSLVTDFSGDCTVGESGACSTTMGGPRNVGVTIPTVPQLAAFITLQSVYYLEALTIMPWVFPFLATDGFGSALSADATAAAGPACPNLLGAADEGAYVFDGCTGEIVQEYPYAGDRFYDAIALVPPAGHDGVHQILATGQNWVHCYIEDNGSTGVGCLGSYGSVNIPDAQYIDPADPSAGALFVDANGGSQIRFVVFDPEQGHFDSHPNRFANQEGFMKSAVAGGPSEDPTLPPNEILAVGWKWNDAFTAKVGLLTHGDMSAEQYGVATTVGELPGNDPRRLRCDLDSGICAVSDFNHDQITIVLWNGTGMPTIASTTAPGDIADGPVGLDVFGNRIVTAGFNDDHYTIIEVDAAGAIVSTTTTALPTGCTQPGHAMFLEDGANTLIVSCWGGGGFARIPNAF